jgi:hypothetical protein
LTGQKAIRPDTVVEIYYDHLIFSGFNQITRIVVGVSVNIESSALDEDVHRKGAVGRSICGGKNICEKTILRPPVPELVLQNAA